MSYIILYNFTFWLRSDYLVRFYSVSDCHESLFQIRINVGWALTVGVAKLRTTVEGCTLEDLSLLLSMGGLPWRAAICHDKQVINRVFQEKKKFYNNGQHGTAVVPEENAVGSSRFVPSTVTLSIRQVKSLTSFIASYPKPSPR